MARDFGPFPTKPMYEVVNRRMQKALAEATSSTGFAKSGQGAVTAGTGAQLVIAAYPDGALVDGLYVENSASETVTLTTNSASTNPRIDRLVMRLDMGAQTIAPFQIVGTPAASPSAPPLVRTATVYDMPLVQYRFPGSASAQNPGSIVDERQSATTWDGIDKATQPMISLNASHGLGTAGTLYQLQNADWDSVVDHGAGLLTLVGGAIRCERAGRVRVEAFAVSDAASAGWSWLSLGLPFGGGSHLGGLDDRRARATGYSGAGQLRQPISAGPVIVQSGDLITYNLAQQNTTSAAVTYQCYLTVTYV